MAVSFEAVSAGPGNTLAEWQDRARLSSPAILQCELLLKQAEENQKSHWRAIYPLELGGSVQTGQYQENRPLSFNPLQYPEKGRDGLSGWDLEVSQRLNLSGARLKNKDLLEARLRYQKLECEKVGQETRIIVAENLYAIQLLGDLASDLRQVIQRLERIRRNLTGSYRDPAMGSYALHSIGANLREHREDLNRVELEKLSKEKELSLLMGGERLAPPPEAPATQMLPAISSLSPVRALAQNALQSQIRIQESHLLAAGLSEPMTLFASGGQKEIGAPRTILESYEKESYVRAGFRLPVFSGGPQLRALRGARQAQAREAVALKNQEKDITHRFELLKKDYSQLREQVLILMPLRQQAAGQINLLERALLLGRISYGDFWSGHELWHKQEVHYVRLVMEAREKLRQIELMAGDAND